MTTNNDFALVQKLLEELVKTQVSKTSKELFESIKEFTPVDTGTAQAGWELRQGPGEAEISNRVPYIGFLEYGTSKKAPVAMVQKSLARIGAKS